MSMPNFLIIGAAKSGTTALHNYLSQHPQIFMSKKKEANFFAMKNKKIRFKGPGDYYGSDEKSIRNKHNYEKLFEKSFNQQKGESSPIYLYYKNAPSNIKSCVPNVKLIVLLRNPIDRAFSSYMHLIRDGREILSFEDGLKEECDRIDSDYAMVWHYRNVGYYYEQLLRYYNLFSSNQIKVILYEDFKFNTHIVLKDIFNFLNVDNTFIPDTNIIHNSSGVIDNKFIQNILMKPNLLKSIIKALLPKEYRSKLKSQVLDNHLRKIELIPETREYLIKEFYNDIRNLEGLISKDLSHWLK